MRIALLRGINVGGHTVSGAVLREVLADLGLRDVRTYLASGNVLFEHDGPGDGPDPAGVDGQLEERIAGALADRLGWAVPTVVRTPAELAAAAGRAGALELAPSAGETLQIGFWLRGPDRAGAAAVEALTTPTDVLRVAAREVYWLARASVGRSKITNARVERAGGGPVTFRSSTTVRRLVELTGG